MSAARPLLFTDFCRQVLKVRLEPAQEAFWRVVADGSPVGGDGEHIFGFLGDVSESARHTVAVVKGARIGFSYVGALRLLHLALTLPLDTLAPGEVAACIIVAPDLRLARQAFRYIGGSVERAPTLAKLVDGTIGADSFEVRRPDGRRVEFVCLPATRGGSAVRARSVVAALLDEAAFFRDADSVVNDEDVYRGIAPRVLPGGQVLIGSTPWAEDVGLLAQLFKANHGHPMTALAAHCPTSLMRSDPRILAMVERERVRDPDNAAREFDAEFLPRGTGLFFDGAAVRQAIEDYAMPVAWPADKVSIGADFGFVSDSSALVVCGRDGAIVRVLEIVELRPEKGSPLQPSKVVEAFAAVARRYGVSGVASDIHYRESIREHLDASGLTLIAAPEGARGKLESYTVTRSMMNEGQLRLPASAARLLAQVREVQSKPTGGGGMTITSPRRKSGHGDIVSALVLACWGLRATHYGPRIPIEILECGAGMAAGWCGTSTDDPYEQAAPIAALRQAMRGTRW